MGVSRYFTADIRAGNRLLDGDSADQHNGAFSQAVEAAGPDPVAPAAGNGNGRPAEAADDAADAGAPIPSR